MRPCNHFQLYTSTYCNHVLNLHLTSCAACSRCKSERGLTGRTCRIAAADWVIMTPAAFVTCRPLVNAITWRRVIADEAHTLNYAVPEYKGLTSLQRDTAVMTELGMVPVAVGRWCLSGTPLKNFRQPQSLDRVFKFVNAGFRTSDLSNLQFVLAFGHIAIRFTKSGTFQVRAHRLSSAMGLKCALL